MILFQTVQVPVTGIGTYSGLALFKGQVANAEACLRGLNLTGYSDGSSWHYRGATVVQITNVSVGGDDVKFTFSFNFSEGTNYQMVGSIDFLVIADMQ
jgi:hypothetical protein